MGIREALKSHPVRNELYHHSIFTLDAIDKASVATLLGQYWAPLHYFPTFLARLTAATPELAVKTAVSTILFEELGEGSVDKAHEQIYIDSLTALGFRRAELCDAAPFAETRELVAVYADTAEDTFAALGSLYATESTDLAIVSGIGKLIRAATGTTDPIAWIDIHVAQEPNHVAQTDLTVLDLSADQEAAVLAHAERMWRAWIAFFSAVEKRVPQIA